MGALDIIRGRQVVIPLTNKSGGSVAAGDVVVINTANDTSFTTTTTSGKNDCLIGVAAETIANDATGKVVFNGYVPLVNVNASVTRGHFGKTHTVAKQATGVSARAAGTFCQFLIGGTTPTAILFSVPDEGAGGAPSADMQAIATHQGTTTITSGSSVSVPFGDTDERDTNSIHDPSSNNTRFTVPTGGAGVWRMEWKIFMAAGTSGGGAGWQMQTWLRKNGSTDVDPRHRWTNHDDSATNDAFGARELVLADADYVEIRCTQASGGDATIGHASAATAKHMANFRRIGPS